MRWLHSYKKAPRRWGGAACALLLMAAGAVAGGEAKIESVRFSFANRLAANAWVPFTARLANPADRAVTVRLALQVDMGPDTAQYLREVTLPARSRRRVDGFARFDYPAGPLRRQFEASDRPQEKTFADGTTRTFTAFRVKPAKFVARLFDVAGGGGDGVGGRELSRQDVLGVPVHPDAYFVVQGDFGVGQRRAWQYRWNGLPFAMGESPAADQAGLSEHRPENETAFSRWLAPDPEMFGRRMEFGLVGETFDFPDKWAAYEGVDAVLLGRLSGEHRGHGLSAAQRHSLLAYVRSGGRLVVMPALDPEGYRHPFWARLLPVRLGAIRPVTDEYAAFARDGEAPPPVDPLEPPPMIEAAPGPDGDVLVERDGLVLLARRAVGAGEV